jgi:dihydrofolate synthase/folylpolyglutamate synthase
MTYSEALRYLESFINYEKIDGYNYRSSLKLERMKRFASLLGDPQKFTKSVHIAGTKGKGSTATYIHSILKNAGFKTGLYTSPHLVDFRERIRINDTLISEEELSSALGRIKDVVEEHMSEDRPSFFEVYTALAYLYFKEKKCDIVVYEVGLGGRLDATNIIEPLVSAITPLSYEHTDKLGGTLSQIAAEKCGIIKSGSICVSAPQEQEALKVVEDTCKARSTRLMLVGRDIRFEEVCFTEAEQVFSVTGVLGEHPLLKSRLIGAHQMVNAATAIGIAEGLTMRGVRIFPDSVRAGIEEAFWPGRLEVVKKGPYIILDGAQNKASAEVLTNAVKKFFKYKKLILVLGVSKDKDIKGIMDTLAPISDSVVLTRSRLLARAMDPERIKDHTSLSNALVTSNVDDAIREASSMAGKDDMILVTGSLFVVGEARQSLQNRPDGADAPE